ncbi:hypothetical protein J6TS7_29020 [Paenibacillus dendritiformis]|uniref:hypothetical protein n=1 Tax=Paenibacillus TaxID=44249 RepID=UPI001B16678C|nr:hypothetical protein [Paenibacillus dendritiformis]GIO79292.1 hypothetical protein J6TS7_29020 [Paenibacillus dendritiformis]
MKRQHGGRRNDSGRKRLGESRVINLNLPDEIWNAIEKEVNQKKSKTSTVIRRILIEYYKPTDG